MDTANPFITASSDHLAKACSAAASDLSANRPRTREERLELSERVRLLLIAAAHRIAPSGSWFSRPEASRHDRDFMSSLNADHAQRLREARYRTLALAAEHHLGHSAHNWMRDATIDGARLYDVALASESGLDQALSAVTQASCRR
jgi:hypothetical protein